MNELTLSQIYDKVKDDSRIAEYKIFEDLFNGDHFSAFSIKATEFKDAYSRLRYITCNFTGLVSKVIADMLFGEPVSIIDKDNQDFINAVVFENKLDTLFYEHSIANSYFGDNLFKIRVENNLVKIEDASPLCYVPELDPHNVRAKPKRIHLASKNKIGDDEYLIVETHEPPFVKMRVGKITKDGIVAVANDAYSLISGTKYEDKVDTKVNRFLVIHVPNWKAKGHFGISDFKDIKELVFALNNRMTKTDNILDKHSDPILAVPQGVLDEEGKVKQKAFTMFEMDEKGNKPEYIVWNANLESAISEIDKLVEFLFMFSETSPDALGMGKNGIAESGRALKMRLLRTIAKRNRKKLYYDEAIKELIFVTELLVSKNSGYKVSEEITNVKVSKAQPPTTSWQDGIVNDETERIDNAIKKLDAGILSKKKVVMELENVEEDEAEDILKEVEEDDSKAADFTSFVDNKGGTNPPLDKDGNPIVNNDKGNMNGGKNGDNGGNKNQNQKPPIKE
jgi:hypothetical protein